MSVALLLTEKPFAAAAVELIADQLKSGGFSLAKLEKYTEKAQAIAAIQEHKPAALIVRSDKIDDEVLAAGGAHLKLVVRAGAGVDTIDLAAATSRGIPVMNTPGQNANAVAELVFGMMVQHKRNYYDGTSGTELMGKTIGLYGFGAVARNVHRLAQAFGMKTLAFDPFVADDVISGANATPVKAYADLFAQADFVSLHIPATPETIRSINHELLMSMPQNAVLINTARADVICEDGLLKALTERTDIGYISDVVPTNLAEIKVALGDSAGKRVFTTPKKMGAQTTEANVNAGIAAGKQIPDYITKKEGERFIVNKDVLKK